MNNILRDQALRLALYVNWVGIAPPCQRHELPRIRLAAHSAIALFRPSCAGRHAGKGAK